MGLVAGFFGTKLGRQIALVGIAVLAILLVLLRVFNAGKKSGTVDRLEQTITNIRTKQEVHLKVEEEARDEARKDPGRTTADVKREQLLDRWSRD